MTRCFGSAASASFLLFASSVAASAETQVNYHCDDGAVFIATFVSEEGAPGTASLAFADGRQIALPQARSADGGRYVGDNTEFWIKGDSASLSIAGKATTCKTIE